MMKNFKDKPFEEKQYDIRHSLEYVFYNLSQNVGNQVYDVYSESGLSKNDFCKRLGISRKTLNKILEGFHNVDLKFIAKIEKEFGYKIDLNSFGKTVE